jgi:hypothetical protein
MARRSLIALFTACIVGAFPYASSAQSPDSGSGSSDSQFATERVAASNPAPPITNSTLPVRDGWSSPALHTTLAASFAGLQALDVATTLRGIGQGRASEANPLMGGLVRHPAALVGVKAGLTAATILSMRGFSKAHPKAAVFTMLALNAGSALVVRSNLRLVMSP